MAITKLNQFFSFNRLLNVIIILILIYPIFIAGKFSDDFGDIHGYTREWFGFFMHQWSDTEGMGVFRPLGWIIKHFFNYYDNLITFRFTTALLTVGYVYFFSYIFYFFTQNNLYRTLFIIVYLSQLNLFGCTDSCLDLHNTYQFNLFFLSISQYYLLKSLEKTNLLNLALYTIFTILCFFIIETFLAILLVHLILVYIKRNNNFKKFIIIIMSIFSLIIFLNLIFRFINYENIEPTYSVTGNLENISSIFMNFLIYIYQTFNPVFDVYDFYVSEINYQSFIFISIILFILLTLFFHHNFIYFYDNSNQLSTPTLFFVGISFLILPVSMITFSVKYNLNFGNQLYYPYLLTQIGASFLITTLILKSKKFIRFFLIIILIYSGTLNFINNTISVYNRNIDFYYPVKLIDNFFQNDSIQINLGHNRNIDLPLQSKTESIYLERKKEILKYNFKKRDDLYFGIIDRNYLNNTDSKYSFIHNCDYLKCEFIIENQNSDLSDKYDLFIGYSHNLKNYQNFKIIYHGDLLFTFNNLENFNQKYLKNAKLLFINKNVTLIGLKFNESYEMSSLIFK